MANLLDEHEWDYVVGSVHFLGDYAVDWDDRRSTSGAASRPPERVWKRYFDAVRESALSGLYDIIGHPDLVKIWGSERPMPDTDPRRYYEPAWRRCSMPAWPWRCPPPGCASRSARSTPRGRCSRWRSTRASRSRCPATPTGPTQLGYGYDQAVELLTDCGVREICGVRGARAAAGAARVTVRAGLGVDTHRFAPGRRLVLGGVEIPFERGLAGHSDADVLAHAVTDAILGAAALGDIGEHFPDTDPRWRDADSIVAAARGGRPRRPRGVARGPRRRHRHARAPEARPVPRRDRRPAGRRDRRASVSVKATTGEGMGFVGREEGVAALAVATLER